MPTLQELHPQVHVAMYSRIAPPWSLRPRVIFDYELIHVESGRVQVNTDAGTWAAETGDFLFFRPDETHALFLLGDEPLSQPHVHFDLLPPPGCPPVHVNFKSRSELTEAERAMMRPDILPGLGLSLPTVLHLTRQEEAGRLLHGLIELWSLRRGCDDLLISARLLELLHLLFEQYGHWSAPSAMGADYRSIRQYIERSFMTELTLDHLSSLFSISKFHLSRQFRLLYGQSPIAYARSLRLEQAKAMLTESVLPISSIGDQLGFDSLYAFSRFFREHAGCSPTRYRELYAKE